MIIKDKKGRQRESETKTKKRRIEIKDLDAKKSKKKDESQTWRIKIGHQARRDSEWERKGERESESIV